MTRADPTKAQRYHDLALATAERAQLETDDTFQSRLYALAEGYQILAEGQSKTAGAGDRRKRPGKPRKQKGAAAKVNRAHAGCTNPRAD